MNFVTRSSGFSKILVTKVNINLYLHPRHGLGGEAEAGRFVPLGLGFRFVGLVIRRPDDAERFAVDLQGIAEADLKTE